MCLRRRAKDRSCPNFWSALFTGSGSGSDKDLWLSCELYSDLRVSMRAIIVFKLLDGKRPTQKKGPVLQRGLEGIPEPVGFERTRGDNWYEIKSISCIWIISGFSLYFQNGRRGMSTVARFLSQINASWQQPWWLLQRFRPQPGSWLQQLP